MRTCLTIFVLLASFVQGWAIVPGDDFNANTAASVSVLQQWYNADGLWNTTGWWNAANCIDAVEGAIIASNGQTYPGVLANTYNLNSSGDFLDGYYDDEGWWAEAWIRAYDVTGNTEFLDMAKIIFADMTGGWDSTCGGGLWWDKTHTYKNAIPNELFLLDAARLHQRTPGDAGAGSYFYWATNEWNWFSNSGMINGQNLINDGLTSTCVNNNETAWTYNQGVILGGLAELYKITGNAAYLSEAETLASASTAMLASSGGVLQEPCEATGCGGGDVPEFKGIFARNLACLYDVDHKPAYYTFLYNNAHSVWFNDRNSFNQLGLKWTGAFDTNDAARQSSAIMPVCALAEPSTALLFFAKGSGDPAFAHSVGQAAGTLDWSCNPSNSPIAGYMQYGPYLASLAGGVHTVHYRMAVSALSATNTSLVQLIIASQGVNQVVVNVPWNAFTQANQAQDFPVTFTNSAPATASEEFRVFWNAAAHGPALTLSDVSIDGFHNWTAANLSHNVGRLDGLNAWEADPIRDPASGYLTTGPGTAELAPGPYTANFELKVDNFDWDDSAIATVSVVNTDANTVVASSSILRSAFPDGLYHPFSVGFQAAPGAHYDFRTYWNYGPNAPRLTQRSVVVIPSGSPGFSPIGLASGSYNQDLVIEHTAPASPNGAYTTASMDAGVTNTGNGWYEKGYDAAAPATGLPAAGSMVTNISATDHVYALASSYSAPNAALVDATHTASITPAVATNFSGLSFLTAAGHGPVVVDYAVHHADGSSESGTMTDPDWFNNTPVAFDAEGRANVVTGSFNSVDGNDPNLYALDIALANTTSAVTRINLTWDRANTGGVAAFFAVSGQAAAAALSNLGITPLAQSNYIGASASFSVTASGTMPIGYQWEENNSPLNGATSASLVLTNLSAAAAGSYSCLVSNNSGAATSPAATLTVLPLPVLQGSYSGGLLTLAWSGNGTLLQATNVSGPWLANPAATSPYRTNPASPAMFYRLRAQ